MKKQDLTFEDFYMVYYTKLKSTGEFIAIKHGEAGYYKATVSNQDHTNLLNERQGITIPMIEAAEFCSMFGVWENFDSLVSKYNKYQKG